MHFSFRKLEHPAGNRLASLRTRVRRLTVDALGTQTVGGKNRLCGCFGLLVWFGGSFIPQNTAKTIQRPDSTMKRRRVAVFSLAELSGVLISH